MSRGAKGQRTFGEMIAALRHEQGLSLAAFAARLGVSRTRLHDIESGRMGVSVARAAQWATALERSPAEFVQLALQQQLAAEGVRGLTVIVTGELRTK